MSLPIPLSPEDVVPLTVGASIPRLTLKTSEGLPYDLNAALAEKPTLLVFYRGSWCPYCNLHLSQLKQIEPELHAMGYQILAVSPDKPENLRESIATHTLFYTLLSDSMMMAAYAFGVAYQVDIATLNQYKRYGVDLEAAAGVPHHMLPVPSAFVLDQEGVVQFAHVDADYRNRIDPDAMLQAVRSALALTTVLA